MLYQKFEFCQCTIHGGFVFEKDSFGIYFGTFHMHIFWQNLAEYAIFFGIAVQMFPKVI